MPRFELQLADKSEWVKTFDPRDGTIALAVQDPPAVGEYVRVDVSIRNGPLVILRGRVVSRRSDPETAAAGCSIALGPEEREKINYLNGYVRGGLLNLRELRRLPLRLDVVYGGLEGPCSSYTRDINEQGVFVVTDNPLPEDSQVHLRIYIPGRGPILASGEVSHTVVVEDEDTPGMGIVFQFTDEERQSFVEAIDQLEKAFLSSTLPEELLL